VDVLMLICVLGEGGLTICEIDGNLVVYTCMIFAGSYLPDNGDDDDDDDYCGVVVDGYAVR